MKSNKFSRWLSGEIDVWSQISEMTEKPKPKEKPQKASKEAPKLAAKELRAFRGLYPLCAVLLCAAISVILILTVSYLPRYGMEVAPVHNEVSQRYIEKGIEETGAVNIVAGMILDYRAFDTLGESHVLFTALCTVMILLMEAGSVGEDAKREEKLCDLTSDPVVREIVRLLTPFILMFGIYVILNGHLSPGGGFSGGAIIGAGLILHSIAFGFEATEKLVNFKVFRTVSLCALLFYSCAKGYSFYMGAHHLENGIPLGVPGAILSSGLILPLNLAVGLVVSCTMYGIYSLFQRGKI